MAELANNLLVLLTGTIVGDARFKALCERIVAGKTPLAAHGLWGSAAPILAGLAAEQSGRPLLYLTAHLDQADDARDDMETVLGRAIAMFPAWETLPGEGNAAGEISAERTRLCAELLGTRRVTRSDEKPPLIVAPIQAIMQPAPSPENLDANTLTLSVGGQHDPEDIAAFLSSRGFSRLDQVEDPGDFALRGGIMDVFWSADLDPLRIEFFGDRIESIRQFEAGSQRSTRTLQTTRITLPPSLGKSSVEGTTTFLDYLDPRTLIVWHEALDLMEVARTILDRLATPVGHYPVDAIMRRAGGFAQLYLSRFASAAAPEDDTVRLTCESLPTYENKATDAVTQLIQHVATEPVIVFCDNEGERERLLELVEQVLALGQQQGVSPSAKPQIETHIGLIHTGFRWVAPVVDKRTTRKSVTDDTTADKQHGDTQGSGFIVVPHHELFRRYTQKRRLRKVAATRPIESFLDLSDGDFVVHVVHGIGKYVGMKTMRKTDTRKSEEFLTLRYADDATIHVPVSQIDLVQKYIGAKAARPPLSKLGGTRWQATKARVEEAVDEMAGDLLRIQAVRESQPGIAFPQDTHWQLEFENAFLYTETPDQLTALRETKTDMTRPRPMDRLLCGDVGYGKTELAIRAAFKVVEFGKQVAVLVPTTVLAEQHFRTFSERMRDYPFVVDCLNRFRTPREQKKIISAAKAGQVDILIGTHRILSKDVGFADLGLVIVDEEQRFGVEHKERLKFLRETVDVLTLTATPIPRTLHMAMIGLRDISSLATPPMDRRSITSSVCVWNDEMIHEALVRELNRDGQVFFVHNRVHSIKAVAARVQSLAPDARIIIGHGQMPGEELEEVMLKFVRREADILVCTSIIESGLDIPNANTIIIDRADIFGLADLHQLRGRVGRYKHRAYCYMLLSPDRPLTSTAAKRLKAIEEYSELGSGFRIAMRDLEIRGAGNILGPEQSGNIAAVGYELYCQLLEKAVRRMRGEHIQERVAVHVEMDIEAYIPKSYIPSDRQRMECYRRVVACASARDVETLASDLRDAFGAYPETVETLLTLTEIKVRASEWNIQAIIKREPDVIFTYEGEVKRLEPLFEGASGSVRIPDGRTFHWRLPENFFHGQTLLRILTNLFRRADGKPKPGPLPVAARKPTAGTPELPFPPEDARPSRKVTTSESPVQRAGRPRGRPRKSPVHDP